MIENLVIQKLTIAGKEYEYPDTTALVGKINELADAVNGILNYAPLEMAMKAEPEPADPYVEQRKWIGKLCRFRDKDYKDDQWDYGLLQAVEKAETAHIWKTGCFKHNLGHWYDFCEPVQPDSELIYHGE